MIGRGIPLAREGGLLTFGTLPMRRYRIAVIPGDGIGKEVIPAGVEVLKAVAQREGGIEWSFDRFDWGSDTYRKTGLMMPDDGREQIKDHDAIYFGAVGSPDVPDHVSLWGLNSRSASRSTNTPMSARRACCLG